MNIFLLIVRVSIVTVRRHVMLFDRPLRSKN